MRIGFAQQEERFDLAVERIDEALRDISTRTLVKAKA
jgi:hypothetical protein